jgi:hypothetical protein
MLVPKEKEGTFLLYIDYRALNNITIKDKTPLPILADVRDHFQGASFKDILEQ